MEFTSCVQFPIAQSLPWILTEFLINTPAAKENIFFAIEIYNDAAHGALTRLEQQHLYNEVEAECSLSFDQLIFHLSNDIFKYFKALASSVNLNKDYYRVLSQKPAVTRT
jgi:cytoplasmic FMR1 interacting protein